MFVYIIVTVNLFSSIFGKGFSCKSWQDTLAYRIDVHAHLLFWKKKSSLHGLILVCMFIDFEKKFHLHVYSILCERPYFGLHIYQFWEKVPPCMALFWSAHLMFSKNFPTCTFISSYTRVHLLAPIETFFKPTGAMCTEVEVLAKNR